MIASIFSTLVSFVPRTISTAAIIMRINSFLTFKIASAAAAVDLPVGLTSLIDSHILLTMVICAKQQAGRSQSSLHLSLTRIFSQSVIISSALLVVIRDTIQDNPTSARDNFSMLKWLILLLDVNAERM